MKTKLTLSIDEKLLREVKSKAGEQYVSLSGLIERFLKFFVRPQLYCFKCGGIFIVETSKTCPKCGWSICPSCKACKCQLSEEASIVAHHMRKVYENLLGGRLMLEGNASTNAPATWVQPK